MNRVKCWSGESQGSDEIQEGREFCLKSPVPLLPPLQDGEEKGKNGSIVDAVLCAKTLFTPLLRFFSIPFLRFSSSSIAIEIGTVSSFPPPVASQSHYSSRQANSFDKSNKQEEEEVEVEEELPWIQEKALDVVNKNDMLCKSIDELFDKGGNEVMESALKRVGQKTGFGMEEILHKYIRYALNEKPFDAKPVKDLIELRKASMLDDAKVAEILNEISRRIVKDKGPVVMDMEGYSAKGFKRKLAVQALFGKIFSLSELSEFCSRDSSLIVKEIFDVTDDDADKLRIHTVSEAGDVDLLEKMVDDSDSEEFTAVSSDP
ncbi:hypothetical protein RJ641_012008 [Dillenia turbinata]|uniref:Armadillo-like repeats domain-containing protein n=1 Tax=Dillenia turbinata TaxID=194707 RepID=A0AAN8V0M4_9MAGN